MNEDTVTPAEYLPHLELCAMIEREAKDGDDDSSSRHGGGFHSDKACIRQSMHGEG
jgi:hypothetical protein